MNDTQSNLTEQSASWNSVWSFLPNLVKQKTPNPPVTMPNVRIDIYSTSCKKHNSRLLRLKLHVCVHACVHACLLTQINKISHVHPEKQVPHIGMKITNLNQQSLGACTSDPCFYLYMSSWHRLESSLGQQISIRKMNEDTKVQYNGILSFFLVIQADSVVSNPVKAIILQSN